MKILFITLILLDVWNFGYSAPYHISETNVANSIPSTLTRSGRSPYFSSKPFSKRSLREMHEIDTPQDLWADEWKKSEVFEIQLPTTMKPNATNTNTTTTSITTPTHKHSHGEIIEISVPHIEVPVLLKPMVRPNGSVSELEKDNSETSEIHFAQISKVPTGEAMVINFDNESSEEMISPFTPIAEEFVVVPDVMVEPFAKVVPNTNEIVDVIERKVSEDITNHYNLDDTDKHAFALDSYVYHDIAPEEAFDSQESVRKQMIVLRQVDPAQQIMEEEIIDPFDSVPQDFVREINIVPESVNGDPSVLNPKTPILISKSSSDDNDTVVVQELTLKHDQRNERFHIYIQDSPNDQQDTQGNGNVNQSGNSELSVIIPVEVRDYVIENDEEAKNATPEAEVKHDEVHLEDPFQYRELTLTGLIPFRVVPPEKSFDEEHFTEEDIIQHGRILEESTDTKVNIEEELAEETPTMEMFFEQPVISYDGEMHKVVHVEEALNTRKRILEDLHNVDKLKNSEIPTASTPRIEESSLSEFLLRKNLLDEVSEHALDKNTTEESAGNSTESSIPELIKKLETLEDQTRIFQDLSTTRNYSQPSIILPLSNNSVDEVYIANSISISHDAITTITEIVHPTEYVTSEYTVKIVSSPPPTISIESEMTTVNTNFVAMGKSSSVMEMTEMLDKSTISVLESSTTIATEIISYEWNSSMDETTQTIDTTRNIVLAKMSEVKTDDNSMNIITNHDAVISLTGNQETFVSESPSTGSSLENSTIKEKNTLQAQPDVAAMIFNSATMSAVFKVNLQEHDKSTPTHILPGSTDAIQQTKIKEDDIYYNDEKSINIPLKSESKSNSSRTHPNDDFAPGNSSSLPSNSAVPSLNELQHDIALKDTKLETVVNELHEDDHHGVKRDAVTGDIENSGIQVDGANGFTVEEQSEVGDVDDTMKLSELKHDNFNCPDCAQEELAATQEAITHFQTNVQEGVIPNESSPFQYDVSNVDKPEGFEPLSSLTDAENKGITGEDESKLGETGVQGEVQQPEGISAKASDLSNEEENVATSDDSIQTDVDPESVENQAAEVDEPPQLSNSGGHSMDNTNEGEEVYHEDRAQLESRTQRIAVSPANELDDQLIHAKQGGNVVEERMNPSLVQIANDLPALISEVKKYEDQNVTELQEDGLHRQLKRENKGKGTKSHNAGSILLKDVKKKELVNMVNNSVESSSAQGLQGLSNTGRNETNNNSNTLAVLKFVTSEINNLKTILDAESEEPVASVVILDDGDDDPLPLMPYVDSPLCNKTEDELEDPENETLCICDCFPEVIRDENVTIITYVDDEQLDIEDLSDCEDSEEGVDEVFIASAIPQPSSGNQKLIQNERKTNIGENMSYKAGEVMKDVTVAETLSYKLDDDDSGENSFVSTTAATFDQKIVELPVPIFQSNEKSDMGVNTSSSTAQGVLSTPKNNEPLVSTVMNKGDTAVLVNNYSTAKNEVVPVQKKVEPSISTFPNNEVGAVGNNYLPVTEVVWSQKTSVPTVSTLPNNEVDSVENGYSPIREVMPTLRSSVPAVSSLPISEGEILKNNYLPVKDVVPIQNSSESTISSLQINEGGLLGSKEVVLPIQKDSNPTASSNPLENNHLPAKDVTPNQKTNEPIASSFQNNEEVGVGENNDLSGKEVAPVQKKSQPIISATSINENEGVGKNSEFFPTNEVNANADSTWTGKTEEVAQTKAEVVTAMHQQNTDDVVRVPHLFPSDFVDVPKSKEVIDSIKKSADVESKSRLVPEGAVEVLKQ